MNVVFIISLIGLVFCILGVGYCLGRVIYFGKRLAMSSVYLKRHRRWVNYFLLSLLLTIAYIEILVVIRGARGETTWLHQIHWGLDVIFSIVILGMWRVWNGQRHPTAHRFLSKFLIPLFCLAAVTGLILYCLKF